MGEVVVITGASAGVGRAVARAFARRGARIGLIARGVEGLEATADEVEALGGQALVVPIDVADAAQVEEAATWIERHLGPIDVWINNAMVTVVSPVKHLEAREAKRVTEVTYLGAVYGTMAALGRMLPRDRGTIVQVGSALAYRAIPLQAAYSGAKHALRGFTDALRSELRHDGSAVHVTEVHLPAVNTPQFTWSRVKTGRQPQPIGPIYEPEPIAEAIFAAAHQKRREFWVGWSTVRAIVGNKLAPGLGDRYLARKGYEGQLTGEPVGDRVDNLYAPVHADRGARGPFEDRAAERSVQIEVVKRVRGTWVAAAVAVIAIAIGAAVGAKL